MKKSMILTILLFCCLLCGCGKKTNGDYSDVLDIKVKSEAISLNGEKVIFPDEHIYAEKYFVYKDTVLIVINRSNPFTKLVEVYNKAENSLINSFFLKGRGPEEVLMSQCYLDGEILIVDDFQQNKVFFIHLDSVFLNTNYFPSHLKYDFHTHKINFLKNGELMILNPYAYWDDVNKKGNKDMPRFIIPKDSSFEMNKSRYDTFNLAGGDVITNDEKNRIIYASGSVPILEVYDGEHKLIKTISGPDMYDIRYHLDDNMLDFWGGTPVSYVNCCATEEKVYLLYYGQMLKIGTNMMEWRPYLFVFDWDGNFQNSYILDTYSYCISTSQDGKTLYASGYDEDNMPILLKYDLK